ncbi:MAG: hypothetical protein ACTSYF_01905, partial [Promethearchaeota archaeon]
MILTKGFATTALTSCINAIMISFVAPMDSIRTFSQALRAQEWFINRLASLFILGSFIHFIRLK